MDEAILNIQDLGKSFGDHEVLRKIDLEVHEGEIICIVGSSGSGKSTLLRCINRLEHQTTGKVFFHGHEVGDAQRDVNEYRAKVGMVFQSFNLFNNLTVLENCMLCTRKVLHLSKEEAFGRAIEHLKEVPRTAVSRPAFFGNFEFSMLPSSMLIVTRMTGDAKLTTLSPMNAFAVFSIRAFFGTSTEILIPV